MNFKDWYDESSKWMYKTLIIGVTVALVFTVAVICGAIISPKFIVINGSTGSGTPVSSSGAQSSDTSLSTSNTQSTITEDTKSEMSTAEIVTLFNESANKIKTEAVKVTKNYEDRTHMEEYLELPSALEGMASTIMEENFKDDTQAVHYTTKEEITEYFQVPGQIWVSQLTESEIAEAKCIDNGTEYEMYIKLKPSSNPEPGSGVAKAFDTITTSEVMEKAPSMVKDFSTEYFDCIIRCKIDKETKRITWINYSSPLLLKLKVEFFGTLDAQIGMKFEKDYNIEY